MKLGRTLMHLLALDYEIAVELFDRLGNGQMIISPPNACDWVISFKEFNAFDEVEIEYNELAEIKRLYD